MNKESVWKHHTMIGQKQMDNNKNMETKKLPTKEKQAKDRIRPQQIPKMQVLKQKRKGEYIGMREVMMP